MTRERLLEELAALRQQVASLEAARNDHEMPGDQAPEEYATPPRLADKEDLLLSQIGQIISSTLEIDDVYALFAQEVRKLVGFDRISINTIDREAGVFTIKYLVGQEVGGRYTGAVRSVSGSQTEHLLATGHTVIREDLDGSQRFTTDPAFLEQGLRSGIMVPLNSKGKIIGSLSLRSRAPGTYGRREQALLERLAQQIAPAVENAELYQRTRQAEEALRQIQEAERRLAAENALLAETGRIISSTLNIDEVYQRFCQETRKLLDFDRMSINVINQEAGAFTFKYVSGLVRPGRPVPDVVPLPGTQTEYVIKTGQTLVRADVATDPRFRGDQNLLGSGMRSSMMAPLKSKGGIIGTLSLRSFQVGAYGAREQAIIERLADQIAPAIENAELYAQTRQAERELRASQEAERRLAQENALLAEAGRIISSTLDIDEVYERFAREMKKLVDFDRVMVNAVDLAAGTYTLRYYFGSTPARYPIDVAKPLDGSMNQHVVLTGETLVRDDTSTEPRFPSDRDNNERGLRASIMVPLKSRGRIIGTLSLRSRRAGAYGDRERSILERLADFITSAIENSELYARTKRAEEELRQSEEQYRILFEQSREAIFLSSPEGQVFGVNQSAVELFGYSRAELMELEQNDFWVHPDEQARWLRELQEQGSVKDMGMKLRQKDGTEMDCVITSNLLRDSNGKVLASQCVVRDVTERKRWEQALQESEQRFRYLVESATDAFIVFNSEGRIVDVNQRAGEMLGYTRDELLQLSVWDIRADQTEPTWPQLWDNLVPGVPVTVERLYRRKDGTTFPVENCIGLVELKGERCLFSITRDITERKQTERMLFNQMRDLAVADERNRLARELHDSVAQSIYSLTLFSETARQLAGPGNEERLEYYLTRLGQTSQQALKEMRLLVHELRPLQLENEGLVGALRHRLDAVEQRAGVEAYLTIDGTVELPPNYEYELYRVAQEALNNSLKHAAATAVTVRVAAHSQRVHLEIQDNGRGFDPATAGGGGGMGLVNIRHRVQELGGELQISSQVNEGTTVKVIVSAGSGLTSLPSNDHRH